MTEALTQLLLRLSEGEPPALLWGRSAQPHFGACFDRLLNARILVDERRAEEWPVCSSCECDLDMRPLITSEDKLMAACPLDHGNDEVLEEDDLRIFRLDHSALVNAIVTHSGLSCPPSKIAAGLWSLGLSPTGIELFLALRRSVADRPYTVDAILRVAHGRRRVLVAPKIAASGRTLFDRAGIQVVAISECLRSNPGRAVPLLDLDSLDVAPSEPRLIIQTGRMSILLDGIELKLSSRPFRLLQYLAEEAIAGQALCERRDIEKRLWSTIVSDKAVADAVRDLRNKIEPILKKGVTSEQLIANLPPARYMLALPAQEIRIDP